MKYPLYKLVTALGASLLLITPNLAADVLQPGQRLTAVISENQPGGEASQQYYFENAFPLAQAAGMRELTTFKVEQVLFGQGSPEGSGLYVWPNEEAAHQVRNNPKYLKELKPLREKSWKELKSVDMDITAPLEINLDRSKPHTLAFVWFKDAAAYDSYYQGTQALRDKMGVKTLLALPGVRHENLAQGETTPPDRVVLLQWQSVEDIKRYGTAPEFQAYLADYQQGVKSIEWYHLGFWH